MKKQLIIALVLIVLLSTFKPQKLFFVPNLNIKEIRIENNSIVKKNDIKKNLAHLYETNIVFLDTDKIKKILLAIDFIESFEIKKKYPNKISIKIYEKKPIAILQNKIKRFYLSDKITLINYTDLKDYNDLPIVFGNKDNFKILYKDLKEINFPLKLIKKYYLYETNRWDLETYDNKIIKLPFDNYIKSLKNFMDLIKGTDFDEYKIFDYRINNQLILK